MIQDEVHFSQNIDRDKLLNAKSRLQDLMSKLFYICINDEPNPKNRKDYNKIFEFVKLASGDEIMESLVCDAPCCSLLHEYVKKMIFLEKTFNRMAYSLLMIYDNLNKLSHFDSFCNTYLSIKDKQEILHGKLFELDAFDKFEHKEELNALATKLYTYAHEDYYARVLRKPSSVVSKSKKEYEEDPARELIYLRRVPGGYVRQFENYRGRFPVRGELIQFLSFTKTFPFVIDFNKHSMLLKRQGDFELLEDKLIKEEARWEKFQEEKRLDDWRNNYMWAKKQIEYAKNNEPHLWDRRTIDDLRTIANASYDEYEALIYDARDLLVEYESYRQKPRFI